MNCKYLSKSQSPIIKNVLLHLTQYGSRYGIFLLCVHSLLTATITTTTKSIYPGFVPLETVSWSSLFFKHLIFRSTKLMVLLLRKARYIGHTMYRRLPLNKRPSWWFKVNIGKVFNFFLEKYVTLKNCFIFVLTNFQSRCKDKTKEEFFFTLVKLWISNLVKFFKSFFYWCREIFGN